MTDKQWTKLYDCLLGIVIALMGIMALLAVLIIVTNEVHAHEAPSGFAYATSCCSDEDCRPAEPGEVAFQPAPEGWHVTAGPLDTVVPLDSPLIMRSGDDRFHLCIGEQVRDFVPYPILLCLYEPETRT